MKRKQLITIGVGIFLLIMIPVLIHLFTPSKESDTSKGVALLKEMETKDISEIEKEIASLQNADNTDVSEDNTSADAADIDPASRNYKQLFANSVIIGDSITEAISAYDFLPLSSVIATIGVNMNTMDSHYEILRNLSPQNIFLSYGSNDIERVGENMTEFKKEYKTIIQNVKSIQPDATIYMNSIFPVQEKKIASCSYYADITLYNAILRELCEEEDLIYLDNTNLVKSEYFEPDDYHFTADFYPSWLNRMAESAGLTD